MKGCILLGCTKNEMEKQEKNHQWCQQQVQIKKKKQGIKNRRGANVKVINWQ